MGDVTAQPGGGLCASRYATSRMGAMTFTQQALQKALTFVQTQGRAIDLARLGRLLGTSSPSELEAELSAYQNSDGGFGHSLEPDFRSPNSSVLATTLAFQIIRETALKTASDMIPQAIAYLLRSFDGNLLTWRLVPYSSTELAQAPWWNEY